MVKKEYEELRLQIERFSGAISEIYFLLDQILSKRDKGFTVTFKDKKYDFHPPTTSDEAHKLFIKRLILTKKLLKYCTTRHIDNYPKDSDHIWQDILCFTMGIDPKEVQFEKYSIATEGSEEIDIKKSISLDKRNYQVKQELEHDI